MSRAPRTAVTVGEIGGLFPRLRQNELTQGRLTQIGQEIADRINSSGGIVPDAATVAGLFTPEERALIHNDWFVLLNMNLQRELALKGLHTASLGPPAKPKRTPNEVFERQAVIDRFRLAKGRPAG